MYVSRLVTHVNAALPDAAITGDECTGPRVATLHRRVGDVCGPTASEVHECDPVRPSCGHAAPNSTGSGAGDGDGDGDNDGAADGEGERGAGAGGAFVVPSPSESPILSANAQTYATPAMTARRGTFAGDAIGWQYG